ncbi:RluA family pseudouridine synthase [Flammeovirga kamogawensis]|uniref:Pseudouridine synthase n=1 Tax=Flammeovirga kamogawensis TaxID=373891 RepID=A0ABX8GUE3_9BACT|nr:RluA family pseudouridine synthase [Flammeovirga kamogawensis]MBB6459970.1 23S rRNA pseudouridine1911/1915/1917 synthase [Flammeovirga kamogawensis]QWG06981.1 RluA family pseudouridine synthase [Flammeovirga kamogawensis]TRX68801.1 RluA family pseudouridine synthase [Flammeovirga kamogawensis]
MIEKKHLHEEFIIPKGGKSTRLDHFLSLQLPQKSRNLIQKQIKSSMVLVNDKKTKSSYIIKSDDKIQWFELYHKRIELVAYNYPLKILLEENEFIVINKPSGMPMHPGLGYYDTTLQNALKYHYMISKQPNALIKDSIVQRLDKDTSGVLVMAKTEAARELLSQQFQNMKPYRTYYALVWGKLKIKKGTIDEFIGRNPLNERSIEVSKDQSFGKKAITHYKVIKEFSNYSLVECRLETGRTHQIRVHMHFIGHPLVGDKRYEIPYLINDIALQNSIGRHCLHAKTLHFLSPKDGNTILKFDSELPIEISNLLK